ncbi:MAG UNVERIFIED_CONTAM: hypothetical protein LVR18_00770 [Planctomycetaceae bacterium]
MTNSTDLRVLSVLTKVPAPLHAAIPEAAGTVPATGSFCNGLCTDLRVLSVLTKVPAPLPTATPKLQELSPRPGRSVTD